MVYWDRKHEIAVKELDAISWSAKKAGVSYGAFVSGMKPEQYTEVWRTSARNCCAGRKKNGHG